MLFKSMKTGMFAFIFANLENWCIEKISRQLKLSCLFYQFLKIRCVSCPREARTPSLPKIGKENVSYCLTYMYF
jgi:hypothetical protein